MKDLWQTFKTDLLPLWPGIAGYAVVKLFSDGSDFDCILFGCFTQVTYMVVILQTKVETLEKKIQHQEYLTERQAERERDERLA